MLVTFKTHAFSDITLFGDSAVSLLKLMGQSGNVPGAIMAEDIPAALEQLRTGLDKLAAADAHDSTDGQPEPAGTDADDNPPVALHTRAGPLMDLLEAASAKGENVLWDQ